MSSRRTPGRTSRLLTGAMLVLATGCAPWTPADSGPAAGPGGPGSPTAPSDPRADPGAPPEPPRRPGPAPDPTEPGECDAETRAAIAETVSLQLEAFAIADFDGAYALTSPFFRTLFSRAAFEELIRTGYPLLVGNTGHRTEECFVRNRRAFLVVVVSSGGQRSVLRYDLSRETDGWRIDGATELPGVQPPRDPLI
jgi:hypothetical protein